MDTHKMTVDLKPETRYYPSLTSIIVVQSSFIPVSGIKTDEALL